MDWDKPEVTKGNRQRRSAAAHFKSSTMAPETIRALANEIVNQTIFGNWLFYSVLAFITVVLSATGTFLSSYFTKRAAHAALTADFAELKLQLRETTSLSESIKIDIKQLAERSESLEWLKREKLEAYVVAILRGVEHLKVVMKHTLAHGVTPTNEDQLPVASMLQALYLPELDAQHAAFLNSLADYHYWLAKGRQRLALSTDTNLNLSAREKLIKEFPPYLTTIDASVRLIEQAAKDLSRELNKV